MKRTRGDDDDNQHFWNPRDPLVSAQGRFEHAQHDKSSQCDNADESRGAMRPCQPILDQKYYFL
jgi:hypothetical protein